MCFSFVIPHFAWHFAWFQNTMEEWTMVFGIVGTVYIVSGCVFILIGSVDVQPWNSDGSTTKTSGAMELKQ